MSLKIGKMMIKISEEKELSDINVTPFIDIMLVLLIIFMVVAPMITSSVKVELPKTTSEQKSDEKKPIILFINEKELSLNSAVLPLEELIKALDEKTHSNKEEVIYLHIDKAVQYERLVQIMNLLKQNDYAKIALSTEIKAE